MLLILIELSLTFLVAMLCEYRGSHLSLRNLKTSHLRLLQEALVNATSKRVGINSYLINFGLSLSWCLFLNLFFNSPIAIIILGAAFFITFTIAHELKFSILKEPLVWTDFMLVKEIYLHPSFYFAYFSKTKWLIIAFLIIWWSVVIGYLEFINAIPQTLTKGFFCLTFALSVILNIVLLKVLVKTKSLSYLPALDGLQGPNASLVLQLAILVFRRREYQKLFVKLKFRESNNYKSNLNHDLGLAKPLEVDGDFVKPNFKANSNSVILIQAESYVSLEALSSKVSLESEKIAQNQGFYALLDLDYQGAYTMRTEFSVLTGINRYDLGIYAYDPYLVAQKIPLNSLAWHYKAQGFTTVCFHPNEKEFFARHKVMANLGFDKFIALDELKDLKRNGPHISDEALLSYVKDLVVNTKEKLFVFVITMEAHGPWLKGRFKDDPNLSALECYERHLKSLDRGLNKLIDSDLQVVVYGDHEPSLPKITIINTCQNELLPIILAFNTPLKFTGIKSGEALHQMVRTLASEGRNA